MTMKPSGKVWVEHGYNVFAHEGPAGLKVERMARQLGISKSSFYHHFSDIEHFMQLLLQKHVQQAVQIAEKENNTGSIDPGLVEVLLAHADDILFSKQLRLHAHNAVFSETVEKTDIIVGMAFMQIWVHELKLTMSAPKLHALGRLALENFYLKVHAENLQRGWILHFFAEFRHLLRLFDS